MRILVLGGTIFLGRRLVDAALARGHELTLFNRGQHNADLYPELEKLRCDRDGGLDGLRGRRWDTVIDPSGYFPRVVRQSAELLTGAVDRFAFISSISVYDVRKVGIDEDARLAKLADEAVEEVRGDTYGGLKALCEQTVEAALPGRAINIRAGLIAGACDPSGRFTFWPAWVARGGDVLAPGRPERPVQFIDAGDLAEWIVRMLETGRPRCLQRHRAGAHADAAHGAGDLSRRGRQRRPLRLDAGRVPAGAGRRAVDGAAALGAGERGVHRLHGGRLPAGDRRRADLQAAGRDRAPHAGLGRRPPCRRARGRAARRLASG